ncbi:GAF domain-containing protein [Pseudarthrobacter siccitolerans]|uniref:GAF domain-containing protein n=1 Tax=Pseudarthrobacter siccitolerans TaxID=861266 RepID=A0ABU0PIZ4_9MICC|nr:GAF and ANTAR domain-containing protein [Pseudarthrobacter siccitolerans]MDQ0673936.1 GAF domain-containing protein [Pseudarthrobacter siccitolerans]
MTVHVQGTSRRVLKADGGRQGVAGVADEPWFKPSGFLLDLVTNADTDAASLRRLAEAAAVALTQAIGVQIDCAVMLSTAQGAPIQAANNGRAAGLGYLEQDLEDGPMKQAAAADGPFVVDAAETTLRWQAYRRRFLDAGYGEVLAVPLRLDPGTTAALGFFAPPEERFDPDAVNHATWFARVASQSLKVALEVRSVRSAGDNLKALLESRTSIDVACGVIMGRNRCSYADAFGLLAGASTQRNKQVREVAEGFLKNLPNGSPGTRFEL